MVIFFMGKCAHIYSKCLMICNASKGRDHVEFTSVLLLPRISEILYKYLLNKSINKIYIYMSNNRYFSFCYFMLTYTLQMQCYTWEKDKGLDNFLLIYQYCFIGYLTLYKQGYTVLCTPECQIVLKFIFPGNTYESKKVF